MRQTLPIFLFAFANDKQHSLQLKEEERIIRSIMDPLHDQNRIIVHYLSNTTLDDIYQTFNRFHNQIVLFHYSGHSGASFLKLEDKLARTAFMSTLMGVQSKLRLVFLNGCSNHAQVKTLFDKGVANIIATSVDIGDKKSIQFSKYFYQALGNNASLLDAFELTKSRMVNDYTSLSIEKRGGRKQIQHNKQKIFPWGLYSQEEQLLNWHLPSPFKESSNRNYTDEITLSYPDINQELVESIFEGISPYSKKHRLLWNLYLEDKDPQSFNMLQNTMLDSFPTSLGIQLRDLFTPEGKTKGRLRLKEINDTYLTAAKLLASICLANLWEQIIDKETFEPATDFRIRASYKKDLKKYLELTTAQASSFDYVWLIATISRIFSDNDIKPFIEEFDKLFNSLYNYDEFYQAYRFLEQQLRTRLLAGNIEASEVEDLCHESEHHLGILLKKCGFLCAYQLVTIKDIGVFKHRRLKAPSFIHTKSILRGRDYATIDDKPISRSGFTSNNSVIVTKDIQHSPEQLNLSPFVIDENAFKLQQEDKLPKIHYFKSILGQDGLFYEHAEQLTQNFEVIKQYNQKKYKGLEILLEQFEQFKIDIGIQ